MLEKIDAWEVFWSILVALMTYISIMITFFFKKLGTIEKRVDERVLIIMCDKYRKECEDDCIRSRQERASFLHKHAHSGQAGEVIK